MSVLEEAIAKDPRMAASLLRLHFHDCFVQGQDNLLIWEDYGVISCSPLPITHITSVFLDQSVAAHVSRMTSLRSRRHNFRGHNNEEDVRSHSAESHEAQRERAIPRKEKDTHTPKWMGCSKKRALPRKQPWLRSWPQIAS
ncbi:hypothetical protein RND71_016486 [Anisodus tanguticus]|uniref:peroxidase n=1 Tax=Anisodus tanguticus TaxID=243964 RepID=A0AAE1S7C1_9SOLA|nr:hypothetical protein RND71_016486 [Anisodus tanguticus]